MKNIIFKSFVVKNQHISRIKSHASLLHQPCLYLSGTSIIQNIKRNKREGGLDKFKPSEKKQNEKKSGFNPIAILGAVTLICALYNSLGGRNKGETTDKDLKKTISENRKRQKERDIKVFFVIGGPSSGKTTLCRNLSEKLDAVHLSPSSLLDKELSLPFSPHSATITYCLERGFPIPTSIINSVLWMAINETDKNIFLIDGFPKKMDQAIRFQELIGVPTMVIEMECPLEDMITRFQTYSEKTAEESREIIKSRYGSIKESSSLVATYYSRLEKTVKVSCLQSEETLVNQLTDILKEKITDQNKRE